MLAGGGPGVDPGSSCATSSAPACAVLRQVFSDSRYGRAPTTNWLDQAWQWLMDRLSQLVGATPEVVWVLLLVALLGLAAFVVWRIVRNSSGDRRQREAAAEQGLTTDPDVEWRAALAAAERGDFREAIRRSFRSALLDLALHGRSRIDASWATRELIAHVRQDSVLARELDPVAHLFEVAWYSHREVDRGQWEAAREHVERIRGLARGRREAA